MPEGGNNSVCESHEEYRTSIECKLIVLLCCAVCTIEDAELSSRTQSGFAFQNIMTMPLLKKYIANLQVCHDFRGKCLKIIHVVVPKLLEQMGSGLEGQMYRVETIIFSHLFHFSIK